MRGHSASWLVVGPTVGVLSAAWLGTVRTAWTRQLLVPAGLDSITWRQINCLGRTVFLENWQSWIDKITGIDPLLEVYKVDYNTTVGTADAWFNGSRWPVAVPANVSSACWDVILVDAPQGYAGDMPGGRQASVGLEVII